MMLAIAKLTNDHANVVAFAKEISERLARAEKAEDFVKILPLMNSNYTQIEDLACTLELVERPKV